MPSKHDRQYDVVVFGATGELTHSHPHQALSNADMK
jgi:glucose-6-phosphate 1-dehydrogenase